MPEQTRIDELVEHDGGIELLIRFAQELRAARSIDEEGTRSRRYLRELTYRSSLLLDMPLDELRSVLDRLVQEVAAARDAEHADRAARRGLL